MRYAPDSPSTRSDENVLTTTRRLAGLAAAAILGTVAALTVTGPALAHTGIAIEPARAGAKNAVASVNAEAESETAGVTKVQLFLPAGITPADVTAVNLPKGWQLTKQADAYTIEGPALPVGRNAEHKVRIRQLPTYESITFKVLQSYSDGRVDRWIGLPSAENPEPENPAPTVKLAGGSGAAPTGTPSPTAASAPPSAQPSAAPTAAEPQAEEAGQSSTARWWVIALVVVAALITGVVVVRRRRSS
jgi:uncharacterized protein YcnI